MRVTLPLLKKQTAPSRSLHIVSVQPADVYNSIKPEPFPLDQLRSMIPEFQDDGNLPVGIHPATLDELSQRFGIQSEIRKVQIESLRWLAELAKRAGVLRLVVNGSFVTKEVEPNDVDCVLLIDENFPADTAAEEELLAGLPFLDIELVTRDGFDFLVETAFASDRRQRPKGMVEVLL